MHSRSDGIGRDACWQAYLTGPPLEKLTPLMWRLTTSGNGGFPSGEEECPQRGTGTSGRRGLVPALSGMGSVGTSTEAISKEQRRTVKMPRAETPSTGFGLTSMGFEEVTQLASESAQPARHWGSKTAMSKPRRHKSPLKHWVTLRLGVPLMYALMRVLCWTWRKRRIGEGNSRLRPAVFAIWHGDLLAGSQELPHLLPVDVLTSRSRDGTLVARYAERFGARTIRGGSSRGAVEALRGMRSVLMEKRSVVSPVDGPRGPARTVKQGVIAAASYAGVPVVPGAVLCRNAWRFRSWDNAFIPKPFAQVEFVYGDPILFSGNMSREEMEQARLKLEQTLIELHRSVLDCI